MLTQQHRRIRGLSRAGQRRWAMVVFIFSVVTLLASIPVTVWIQDRSVVAESVLKFCVLAFSVSGLLIARRQPENRIAWIMLAIGALVGLGSVLDPYATYGIASDPGSLPAAGVVAGVNGGIWVPPIVLAGTYLILLFPDGRLPTARWRPVAWASGITMGLLFLTFTFMPGPLQKNPQVQNPLGIDPLKPVLEAMLFVLPALPLCMLACAAAVVIRFRRSRDIERLQLKWLASAGGIVASVYLTVVVLSLSSNAVFGRPSPGWLDYLSVLSFSLIPVAIGVAVLKHGLYGIDRLISRTVSYAVITGTLLAVYLALVTTISTVTPKGNSLGVAASTLAVAALFQPLRRRVQTAVDHRFNRARYDAARTVDAFSLRLRDEVDLEAVRHDLLTVVRQAVQPASVGLWLREPG